MIWFGGETDTWRYLAQSAILHDSKCEPSSRRFVTKPTRARFRHEPFSAKEKEKKKKEHLIDNDFYMSYDEALQHK